MKRMSPNEIARLERLNRELLDCAAGGRWEALRSLEAERRALLQRLLRRLPACEATVHVQRAVEVDRVIVRLSLRRGSQAAASDVRRAAG